MYAKFSPSVQKELKKIHQKDEKLTNRIEKQIALFEENSKHPSLRTHKLSGTMDNMWNISITTSIRMVYVLLDKSNVIFVKIGTHDEVYGK
ncbi:MAG: type II toxin-antitoxin system mRNA interferase toxin, RelE/StbE family [bacterium]|nr:type II toxin-antitoxin system mRNA interferase toxin, RelE/StbE family [bacterium]